MPRPEPALRPAVFLDRDGTVVVERHYLKDPDDVELVPGAADALYALRDAGYALVVVTNQSGIARGYYTQTDFRAVQKEYRDRLDSARAELQELLTLEQEAKLVALGILE